MNITLTKDHEAAIAMRRAKLKRNAKEGEYIRRRTPQTTRARFSERE